MNRLTKAEKITAKERLSIKLMDDPLVVRYLKEQQQAEKDMAKLTSSNDEEAKTYWWIPIGAGPGSDVEELFVSSEMEYVKFGNLLAVWYRLCVEANNQQSLVFHLADGTLAQRCGISRQTVVRLKRIIVAAGLAEIKILPDKKERYKKMVTAWKLKPRVNLIKPLES